MATFLLAACGNDAAEPEAADPTPEETMTSEAGHGAQTFGPACDAIPKSGAGSFDGMATEPEFSPNTAFSDAVALLPHRVWSAPVFTVGEGVMAKVTLSFTALQVPLPAEVNVNVTVPAAISAAVGA